MSKRDKKFSKSQAWLDWLSDEPPVSSKKSKPAESKPTSGSARPDHNRPYRLQTSQIQGLRSMSGGRPQSRQVSSAPIKPQPQKPKKTQKSKDDPVVINFHLPTLKLPKADLPWKKIIIWFIVIALIAVAVIWAPRLSRSITDNKTKGDKSANKTEPAYKPLKPTSGQVSGEAYDGKRQMYKYEDIYKESQLTISQQPLPDDLRNNPQKVKALATSIGASDKLDTIQGDVYVSTDDQTSTQRLLVVHRQLLIFIQSTLSLNDADWVEYVQQLK